MQHRDLADSITKEHLLELKRPAPGTVAQDIVGAAPVLCSVAGLAGVQVRFGSVAVSPAATVSAATTATATPTAVTTAPTPAAAAAGTLFARAGDVHTEGAAAEFFAVHGVNGLLRFFRRTHRDEGKAARPARGAVGDEVGFDDGAVGREGILQVVLGDFEVEVADE